MGIAVTSQDRIIIQGITGRTGRAAAARMAADGTPLVAGVAPGRAGVEVEGRPVYETVYEARDRVGATASFVSVPAMGALDAVLEAIEAGLETVVVYTEHVPIQDAMRMRQAASLHGTLLLGPNSAGCVTPGQANLSDLDGRNLRPGRIGIVSKSGTLTYEVVDGVVAAGEGISSVVCLGGDPVIGTDHAAILERFEADEDTASIVMMGEIGGRSELRAAELISAMTKPVIAFVAGHHAPPGKRMGHAGALLARIDESAAAKSARLEEAGATIALTLSEVAAAAVARLD